MLQVAPEHSTITTPQPELYRRARRALMAAANTASPLVGGRADGLDVDLAGSERLWRSAVGSDDPLKQAEWWGHTLHERIRDEVCDLLMDDPEVNAADVEVEVKDGEVTLTGTLENRRAKRRAEDLAEHAVGVKDVHNRIRIGGQGGA